MDIGKSLRAFAEKMNGTMFGGKPFTYPADHKLGMRIPEGGSSCSNCKFLGASHKTCTHKQWIAWNAGKDKLPYRDEEYCCDLFQW